MNKYFVNIGALDELRKQYKELLKLHHPDNGGNIGTMQEINAEYDRLFKVLKNKHDSSHADSTGSGKSACNKNMYDWENDKALREALEKIINFNGIEITICGQWIWVSGNTYSFRKELKEAGYKYAPKKKQWYFHTEAFRKKNHKTLSMEDIKNYYGSTEIKPEGKVLLMQA